MSRYSASVLIFFAIGFGNTQEPDSPKVNQPIRHILRFATNKFDKVSENSEIRELNNENQSLEVVNHFKELAPSDANMVGKIHDLPQNASSEHFFEALKKIEEEIKPSDELVVYIASHGFEYLKSSKYRFGDTDQGESLYIVTNEPMEDWVPLIEVTKYLSRSKFQSSKKLVLANCSRHYLGRSPGNANIGKKWQNHDQTNELDSNGRLLVNSRMVALEEGRTDIDMNLAVIFACSSGLQAYEIREKKEGVFDNALVETLAGGPSGYKSVEALFEKVRNKTDRKAIRVMGKPQTPTMVVFAHDAESYVAMARQWKVGQSDKAESEDKLVDDDLAVKVRTIEDAIGKNQNVIDIKNFDEYFSKIKSLEISIANNVVQMPRVNVERLQTVANVLSIVEGSGVNIGGASGYAQMAIGLLGRLPARQSVKPRDPTPEELEDIKKSFESTSKEMKQKSENLKETVEKMQAMFNDLEKLDIGKLIEENKKLRNALGLLDNVEKNVPKNNTNINQPRRRGFFR